MLLLLLSLQNTLSNLGLWVSSLTRFLSSAVRTATTLTVIKMATAVSGIPPSNSSRKSPTRTGLALMKYCFVSGVKPEHMNTFSTS